MLFVSCIVFFWTFSSVHVVWCVLFFSPQYCLTLSQITSIFNVMREDTPNATRLHLQCNLNYVMVSFILSITHSLTLSHTLWLICHHIGEYVNESFSTVRGTNINTHTHGYTRCIHKWNVDTNENLWIKWYYPQEFGNMSAPYKVRIKVSKTNDDISRNSTIVSILDASVYFVIFFSPH